MNATKLIADISERIRSIESVTFKFRPSNPGSVAKAIDRRVIDADGEEVVDNVIQFPGARENAQ